MRITTMIIIVITVLLTIVLMQNTDRVTFTILFTDVRMSKLVALGSVGIVAFILGILVGRPKRAKQIGGGYNEDDYTEDKPDTLSDEDREYISH